MASKFSGSNFLEMATNLIPGDFSGTNIFGARAAPETIRNSHSNLEIIFGNVLSIVCLEKETKGGTIRLFDLIMKADKYFQFYKLFPFRILQYSLKCKGH
jgi:hypothetical protein